MITRVKERSYEFPYISKSLIAAFKVSVRTMMNAFVGKSECDTYGEQINVREIKLVRSELEF